MISAAVAPPATTGSIHPCVNKISPLIVSSCQYKIVAARKQYIEGWNCLHRPCGNVHPKQNSPFALQRIDDAAQKEHGDIYNNHQGEIGLWTVDNGTAEWMEFMLGWHGEWKCQSPFITSDILCTNSPSWHSSFMLSWLLVLVNDISFMRWFPTTDTSFLRFLPPPDEHGRWTRISETATTTTTNKYHNNKQIPQQQTNNKAVVLGGVDGITQ